MRNDLLDPPELPLAEAVFARRRAHLRRELERQPTPHRYARWTLATAASLVLALAVTLAVSSQFRSTRLTLVDQALAAIGTGPTIHVVLEVPNAAEIFDPKTGTTRSVSSREEFWSDAKLGTIFENTIGSIFTNRVVFPRRSWGPAAREWSSFVSGYRKALQHGSFRVVSTGQIDGNRVEWITPRATPLRGGVEQIAISTETFKPLYIRYATAGGVAIPGTKARVVVAESGPRRPALFAHAKPTSLFSGGQTSTAGGHTGIPTTLSAARAAMDPDPVVPPSRIAGLPRRWLGLPEYLIPPATSYRDQVNGLSLYYGRLDEYGDPLYTGRYISINEIPSQHAAYAIWGRGFFRADGTAVVLTSHLPGDAARATLKVRGLYVAIQASSTKAAIAAVHALTR